LQYAGGIAQFNAKGVAIFRNVAFVTASVEQRVVLGNPFLMSVSGRVLNVACTVCAPARLDITLLWAGAQQWATAVDHDIGYNLTFAIADALGIEVGNVTLMRVVALSSDTDMATIPITILLISTIISQSYADLLQRPAAHLELMHAVSAKGLRFNSTGMVVAGAKPPFKCRLQVSQRVSKYTDYLHEGQSFQMEIRRVDCRGQDVACPPFPSSFIAKSLMPDTELINAVPDYADPAGVRIVFSNLTLIIPVTRIFDARVCIQCDENADVVHEYLYGGIETVRLRHSPDWNRGNACAISFFTYFRYHSSSIAQRIRTSALMYAGWRSTYLSAQFIMFRLFIAVRVPVVCVKFTSENYT
jgi:hypothetical protein